MRAEVPLRFDRALEDVLRTFVTISTLAGIEVAEALRESLAIGANQGCNGAVIEHLVEVGSTDGSQTGASLDLLRKLVKGLANLDDVGKHTASIAELCSVLGADGLAKVLDGIILLEASGMEGSAHSPRSVDSSLGLCKLVEVVQLDLAFLAVRVSVDIPH